jgi:hypothetical protein
VANQDAIVAASTTSHCAAHTDRPEDAIDVTASWKPATRTASHISKGGVCTVSANELHRAR